MADNLSPRTVRRFGRYRGYILVEYEDGSISICSPSGVRLAVRFGMGKALALIDHWWDNDAHPRPEDQPDPEPMPPGEWELEWDDPVPVSRPRL
ncbi:hypothetical protein V6B08_19835 [Ferrovibrio sp. MS7]|uniref:hypothetical protein n=1 Tax=Ferrovibrio plantarum TaxID=3119164 RepID=UPI003134C00F